MADDQKNNGVMWLMGIVVVGAITAGIAVLTQSGKTSQANQQDLIDNLPAVIAELDVLKSEVEAIQGDTLGGGEIEARFSALVERINGLEGQLTRRFDEVVKQPMDIIRDEVETNEEKIERLLERIARLEALAQPSQQRRASYDDLIAGVSGMDKEKRLARHSKSMAAVR